MSYQRPGIEVSQVVRSSTPILTTPDLPLAVVGRPLKWLKPSPENDDSILSVPGTYSGVGSITIDLSSLVGAGNSIVTNTVVVDIQNRLTGAITHLTSGLHFTHTGTNLTLLSGVTAEATPITPIVGFASTVSTAEGKVTEIESVNDIVNVLKLVDSDAPSLSPLGFGALLAMQNAGNQSLHVYGVSDENADAEHLAAQDALELLDTYSIGVLSSDATSISSYSSYVTAQSLPTAKKERIAFISNPVVWSDTKAEIVAAVQSVSSSFANKRVANVFSDIAYVEETRHISTLTAAFISAIYGVGFTARPLLTQNVTLGGIAYKRGEEITSGMSALLVSEGKTSNGYIQVLMPVPGYFYTAALAGSIAGKSPQQPLTNAPIVGFAKTYRTSDYFTEAQLNSMAGAGTWIMIQDVPNGAITTRHQVSTDNTSVTKREMSITNAVDYAAKMMRASLKPYIGRFTIDDNFISLVFTVLTGIALFLRRSGILRDVKITSVVQDSLNPDTVLAEVELIPLYPANYIKITLII